MEEALPRSALPVHPNRGLLNPNREAKPIDELCPALTGCANLSSALFPLANGGPEYSARTAPSSHTMPGFVTVSCRPWGFDYVNGIARYFWQGAMANCERMYMNPASHPPASRIINNSPCAVCGYDFEALHAAHVEVADEQHDAARR